MVAPPTPSPHPVPSFPRRRESRLADLSALSQPSENMDPRLRGDDGVGRGRPSPQTPHRQPASTQ
ncbi:hypothetical protein D9602_10480 [Sphingomonas sp. TX0522]|nr:hypothetical protein [Sphingomonas sp. TX0522]